MARVSAKREFICDICDETFEEILSITLPCGYLICRKHIDLKQAIIECLVCKDHGINIQDCLTKIRKNKEKNDFYLYHIKLEEIKAEFEEFKRIEDDPSDRYFQCYDHIMRVLDVRRNDVKQDINEKIDKYYLKLTKRLEDSKQNKLKVLEEKLKLVDFDEDTFFKEIDPKNLDFKPNMQNQIENFTLKIETELNKLKSIKNLFIDAKKNELSKNEPIEKKLLENIFGKLVLIPVDSSMIWNRNKGNCIRTLNGHRDRIFCVKLLSENEIVSGSADKTIKVWDKNTGECTFTLTGHTGSVICLQVLSPAGIVISGSGDNTIKMWDVDIEQCLNTFKGHTSPVWALDSLNSKELISGSEDKLIKIWRISTGECLNTIAGHTSYVTCVRYLDSSKIISSGGDKEIKVWDKDTGDCLKTLKGHTGSVLDVQVLNSECIASSSFDKEIKIWDINTGELVDTLAGHAGRVRRLAVGDSGELISASEDGTIKIWDIENNECKMTLEGHAKGAWDVLATETGEIISCSDDLTIKIWK